MEGLIFGILYGILKQWIVFFARSDRLLNQ